MCPTCGNRLSQSEKYCNKCGAINYHNTETIEAVIEENQNIYKTYKKAKTVHNGLRVLGILLVAFGAIIDLTAALLAITGDMFEIIGLLPIGGIAFICGLVILFVFK